MGCEAPSLCGRPPRARPVPLRANGRKSEMRVLGGSWVVINGVILRVTILISHLTGLITPLITAHEPPGRSSTSRETVLVTKRCTVERGN